MIYHVKVKLKGNVRSIDQFEIFLLKLVTIEGGFYVNPLT